MTSPIDVSKLTALANNPQAGPGYRKWLDSFFIPLLTRVGLKVSVRRAEDKYTITVKLPK